MNKINFITISLASISMICACQKNELADCESGNVTNNGSDDPSVIVCSTPAGAKTTYGEITEDGTYPVVWIYNDYLEVYSSDGKVEAKYVNDLIEGEKVADTPFHGDNGYVTGAGRVAVYPSTRAKGFDGENLTIDFSVLTKQKPHSTLADNWQNIAYFPMYAVEDSQTAGKFVFNNTIGCVNFKLNDYQGLGLKIKSVKVTSKSLGIVSNSGKVSIADGTITLPAATKTNSSLTIEYATGFNIKTGRLDQSKECYVIGLPATTYPADDLTFEFTDMEGRIYTQTLTKELTLVPGKIRTTPVLNFTLSYGTSNCYVVNPSGSVDIDITPKYTFSNYFDVATLKNVGGTLPALTAEVLWQQLPDAAGGTVLDGTPEIEGNTLKVKAGANKGNALVAIKADNVIVWSFHIWVTETPSDQEFKIGTDKFDMMDRNLGATLASDGEGDIKQMYGLLYQWGRKDPMAVYSTTNDSRSVNTAISAKASSTSGNIAYSIQNPTVDIYNQNDSWLFPKRDDTYQGDATQYAALWGAPESEYASDIDLGSKFNKSTTAWNKKPYVKTVYDPCPEGYQVPEGYCLRGLYKDNLGTSNKYKTNPFLANNSIILKYDGTNSAYFPLAGCFSNNLSSGVKVANIKTRGYYWTATPRGNDGKTSHLMQLVNTQFSGDRYLYQANACSVRCVKTSTLYD